MVAAGAAEAVFSDEVISSFRAAWRPAIRKRTKTPRGIRTFGSVSTPQCETVSQCGFSNACEQVLVDERAGDDTDCSGDEIVAKTYADQSASVVDEPEGKEWKKPDQQQSRKAAFGDPSIEPLK